MCVGDVCGVCVFSAKIWCDFPVALTPGTIIQMESSAIAIHILSVGKALQGVSLCKMHGRFLRSYKRWTWCSCSLIERLEKGMTKGFLGSNAQQPTTDVLNPAGVGAFETNYGLSKGCVKKRKRLYNSFFAFVRWRSVWFKLLFSKSGILSAQLPEKENVLGNSRNTKCNF